MNGSVHPLPEGTRVRLKFPSAYSLYRIFKIKKQGIVDGRWRYTICPDEYWETKGIHYIQLGPDVGERSSLNSVYETEIDVIYDLPQPPTAEEVYEHLRARDA